MTANKRAYSDLANGVVKKTLNELLSFSDSPREYRSSMVALGGYLGEVLSGLLPAKAKCLVASTAEDADYLTHGVLKSLEHKHEALAAVFWNNHYTISGGSIAPIVHKYLQPGYKEADFLVIVKSIISGSCVVRTNILALVEELDAKEIYIVSPVMHVNSEASLIAEFPVSVSSKFKFIYFAIDADKDNSGEVLPGIGGQIYDLLGIGDQPAKNGYMPNLVLNLAAN